MDYRGVHKKFQAAQVLLLEPTTTREKFSSIKTLIQGIHPEIDKALAEVDRGISNLENGLGGNVIDLTLENLPETTEEERKRKRALLLFLKTWNTLKSEVARVEKEMQASQEADTSSEKSSHFSKIFRYAKGPLGIITLAAVAIVLAAHYTAVQVDIQNQGCGVIQLPETIPVSLPGLSLPKGPIPDGGSASATLPPLTVDVDAREGGSMAVSSLAFSTTFEIPFGVRDIVLDGVSLLGKETQVRLSERKEHTLVIRCGVDRPVSGSAEPAVLVPAQRDF